MKKLVVLVLVAVPAILFGTSIVLGQEATPDDVKEQFVNLTRAEVEAMGYVVVDQCISAETVGAPEELGAQGFHALNGALIDTKLDPLEPEGMHLDAEDNVMAVEYLTPRQEEPLTVLGQQLHSLEGSEIDVLHLWFLDNPAGQFADFNTNATCNVALPEAGIAGYQASDGGPGSLVWALAAGLVGSMLMGAGWTLSRTGSR